MNGDDESVTFACVDIKTLVQSQPPRLKESADPVRFSGIHNHGHERAREALKYLVAV